MTEASDRRTIEEMYWQVLRAVSVTAASTGLMLLAAVALATFGAFFTRAHQWGISGTALVLIVVGTWGAFEAIVAFQDVREVRANWERVVLRYTLALMTAANVLYVLAALIAAAGLLAAVHGLGVPGL